MPLPSRPARHVAVEGLIGVGKTTLCRQLAQAWGAKLVLEPHEDNSFLEAYYRDPARYALPVQISFLLSRFRQIDEVRQVDLFHTHTVCDYVFEKDRLFAEKTLKSGDFLVYERLAAALQAKVPVPDLVVVLHAPMPVLLQRIRKRGIKGEEKIDRAYLEDLARRYEKLWSDWDRCPVLTVNNVDLPYDRDDAAKAEVLKRIENALEKRDLGGGAAEDATLSLFGARNS